MVPGRVARVFAEESRVTEQSYSREESSHIFRTAFLLFAGYVDAATTFAQNCGGGGSAPDQNWGRDQNEDDILWARRCFRKAREMVTTPVRKKIIPRLSIIQKPSYLSQYKENKTKMRPAIWPVYLCKAKIFKLNGLF